MARADVRRGTNRDARCLVPRLKLFVNQVNSGMGTEGWYRYRGYPHFDREVSRKKAEPIVTCPAQVARHAFFPFIQQPIVSTHYKRTEGSADQHKREIRRKRRSIFLAAHLDAQIYSYYAKLIGGLYDSALQEWQISDVPIAYRSLNGKCNIDFAYEIFEYMRAQQDCCAIAMDVRGFFDNLDHEILKGRWTNLLGQQRLPDDHFKIFRSVTSYSFVTDRRLRRIPACRDFYLRPREEQRGQQIISAKEFRQRIRGEGYLLSNKEQKGIPQGLPISPVLSNAYMIRFDQHIGKLVREFNGLYRRYSDDIMIVCPPEHACRIIDAVNDQLERHKLKVNEAKTEKAQFRHLNDGSGELTRLDGKNGPFQYLGFQFDGDHIRIRDSSSTRFNRRMRRAVRRASKSNALGGTRPLPKRRLYERYTCYGKRNYVAYANRAADRMDEPAIKAQLRNHCSALKREITRLSPNARSGIQSSEVGN